MTKKRRGIPVGRGVSYARCRDCPAKYRGIIKDVRGRVERRISCQTHCFFLVKGANVAL